MPLWRDLPLIIAKLMKKIITMLALIAPLLISVQPSHAQLSKQVFNDDIIFADKQPTDNFGDAVFHMLKADINQRQGHKDEVMASLLHASMISDDWRISQQASYYALRNKQFTKAEDSALRWLQIESVAPESSKARVMLSLAYLGQNKNDAAMTQFLLALSETRDSPKYNKEVFQRFALDLAYLNAGQAIAIYDRALNKASAQGLEITSQAYLARAILAYRLNNMPAYRLSLLATLQLDNHNVTAATMLLEFYTNSKYPNKDEVNDVAKRFIKANKKASGVRLAFAEYLYSEPNLDEAKDQFDYLVKTEDSAVATRALFMTSIISFLQGDITVTVEKLNDYLDRQPNDDKAWHLLCEAYDLLDNEDAAINACGHVVNDPLYFNAQLKIANIMVKNEAYQDAIDYLSELVIEDAESRHVVTLEKYDLYLKLEQYEAAKALLEDTLTMYPNNTGALYMLGLWHSEHGSLEAVEAIFSQVIEVNSDNAHAYNAWGYTLAERTQDYQRALTLVQKANTLLPNNPYILDSLGWVYFKLADYAKAIKYLEQALALDKDSAIVAHLIETYWQSGEKDKAMQLLAEFINSENVDKAFLQTTAQRLGMPL